MRRTPSRTARAALRRAASYEPVVFEESVTDFVNLEDFGHTPARTWDEVTYVWRRVFMTRRSS
jgi:hypothetical protein